MSTTDYEKSSDWMTCRSKRKPGLSYYFNTKTGESVWMNPTNTADVNGKEENSRETRVWDSKKNSTVRTPAQDRLKEFQEKLKKDSHKSKGVEKNNRNRQSTKRSTSQNNKKAIKRVADTSTKCEVDNPKRKCTDNLKSIPEKEDKIEIDKMNTPTHKIKNIGSKIVETCKKSMGSVKKKVESLSKTSLNITKQSRRKKSKSCGNVKSTGSESFTRGCLSIDNSILKAQISSVSNTIESMPYESLKGSANARLIKLRKSLQDQILNKESKLTSNITKRSKADMSDTEEMDWQTTDINDTEIKKDNDVENQMVEISDQTNDTENLYGRVNENLLRLAAERKLNMQMKKKQWFSNYYYFVVDTNILINNLMFIKDISEMKLCDTSGTIIYLPYYVLQELDKLKMQSGKESVRLLAVRAIKYLNQNYNSSYMQVQSAVDERHHQIKVMSADDSILNCCLQVKQHVHNVLLLTEDANLQNKALCNGILVSTKSDLVSINVNVV